MALRRMNKFAALALTAVMAAQTGLTSFVPLTVEAKEAVENQVTETVVNSSSDDNFTWDNATMYFVITDRFYNGDTTNDHSYGRSIKEKGADNYANRQGTFHGGDLKGLTQKIEEGYFDELGINSIWITAPYEQIHGAMSGDGFKSYAYHGYWTLDFSQMDANMGTEEDMKTFVDTAHKHGIRVVMDVVMNHVGYPDPYTANEYGFGSLASNWEDIYYNWDETRYKWYNDYVGEGSSNGSSGMMNYEGNWASTWWGPNWVRAVETRFQGYDGTESGGDLTICSSGLPDIKTENGSDNGIPPILKTKWQKEGIYEQETKELDDFFDNTDLGRRNVNYVIKWLTDYVREYGIDGFRCDTAKHVELEHWNNLKKESQKALEEWRKNHPDDVAASWDEDFWMTGEVYGYSGGKNSYFSNGFDSLINFGFQGKENTSGAGLDSIYSGYASSINSDSTYNLLTYISSHDKGLGARSANAGTALLLCPGGVQIYYGDETGRTGAGYANGEQQSRSQMNWDSIDTGIQSNWQKIGQFRRNHAAIGAGEHNKLSGEVYTFSRTYHVGQDDEDKVVVALPTKAGTFDVSVGDIFADGETVRDAYSGEEYTVSGGSVSATCDSNGVILLEGSKEVKSAINARLTAGSLPYTTETIKIKLSATKATDTYYTVNDGEPVAFADGDVIEIGGGAAYDEVTTVTLTGKGEDGSELSKELTYAKCSEPSVSDGSCAVKVAKSEFSKAPYCYAYASASTALNGIWPGKAMTEDGDYWIFEAPEGTDAFEVILSDDDGWRSTPHGQEGINIAGVQLYTKSTGKLTELPSGEPAKVKVQYVNEAGTVLKEVYRVGAVGAAYETSAAVIKGCTLKEKPKNATGKFTAEEITVTYVYSGGEDITPVITTSPVTETPSPTQAGVTDTPTPTAEATETPSPTQAGATDTPTPTLEATEAPEPTQPVDVDCTITVSGNMSGVKLSADVEGMGDGVRYMFTYEKDGKEYLIQNFQKESSITWVPTATGKYKFNVYVIENGNIISDGNSYTVR